MINFAVRHLSRTGVYLATSARVNSEMRAETRVGLRVKGPFLLSDPKIGTYGQVLVNLMRIY
jgi:hypothetical protein